MSKRPNVFIFFLDTIRVDQLKGCDTPGEPENFVERILHQGTFFSNFIVAGNSTRISVNALFNGFYGSTSGLNFHYQCDDAFEQSRLVTLADVFRQHGYSTLGISQGDVYLPTAGFDRFSIFQESFDLDALETSLARGQQPTFAYLHFSNLHDLAFGSPERMTAETYRKHLNQLAEEVEQVWNRLVGPDDVVVIVSDHGCNLRHSYDPDWRFFYEEEPTGGIFLGEATIRGICSIVAPGRFPVRRVEQLVRGIDIFPTLLDGLGLKRPKVQGRSLWSELGQDRPWPQLHAFAEAGGVRMADGEAVCRSLRTDRWKYNRYETHGEQIFDLADDPAGQHNLIGCGHPQEALLRRLFAEQVAENRQGAKAIYGPTLAWVRTVLAGRPPLPEIVKGKRSSCFQGLIDERVRSYLREHVARHLPRWRQQQERVVIYSASEHARTFFAAIGSGDLSPVVGIVDSNPALGGSRFCGLPVYPLQQFECRAAPTLIVVAHHFFANDMYVRIKETCRRPIPVFNLYHLDREIPLWWDRGTETLPSDETRKAASCP
jgi:arylsulfatase A-like enzyme